MTKNEKFKDRGLNHNVQNLIRTKEWRLNEWIKMNEIRR